MLILVGSVTGSVAASLALPDYMATIINKGVVGGDNRLIWTTGGIMLLFALAGALSSIVTGWVGSRLATAYARDMRAAIFTKVENFSLAEFNNFSTASLITRTTNDVQQVQTVLVMVLRMALMAPIMGVWAIVKAYHTAPSMTWIMALAVGILLTIIITIFAIAIPKYRILQTLTDRLNLVTREILTGLRVIRAFNREDMEEKKFDRANTDLMNVNMFINRLMAVMMPIMILLLNVTMLGVVWFGAQIIDKGSLEIGGMLAFMQYAMQSIFAFLMISMVFIMVPRASVSLQRISEVLKTEPIITDPEHPKKPNPIRAGQVSFDHVSFAYTGADTPILHDVTFTAEPGQTTAIVGSTGSGKSTLINLIPRFYDRTSGAITIDGVDIKDMTREDVYGLIGYVPQKGLLFSGSVLSNLQYGAPDATLDEVKKAAETAQASEFIAELDKGYESDIAQGGKNVSGGQKQRLAIARAIIRKPAIYIFDDSFSALDFTTDAKLRAALQAETSGKTVLIVAQRISTILDADKIVVLDEGRIVGQGTHSELLKTCTVYREIAQSQLSEQELEKHLGAPVLQGAIV